jgi:hypothetical protein
VFDLDEVCPICGSVGGYSELRRVCPAERCLGGRGCLLSSNFHVSSILGLVHPFEFSNFQI